METPVASESIWDVLRAAAPFFCLQTAHSSIWRRVWWRQQALTGARAGASDHTEAGTSEWALRACGAACDKRASSADDAPNHGRGTGPAVACPPGAAPPAREGPSARQRELGTPRKLPSNPALAHISLPFGRLFLDGHRGEVSLLYTAFCLLTSSSDLLLASNFW